MAVLSVVGTHPRGVLSTRTIRRHHCVASARSQAETGGLDEVAARHTAPMAVVPMTADWPTGEDGLV
jgi:hypothetical protein